MSTGKRFPPPVSNPRHSAAQRPAPQHTPGVLQPKAAPLSPRPTPTPPPVYRPQPVPKVLQRKATGPQPPPQPHACAPACRHGQTPPVLQPKSSVQPSPSARTPRTLVAPPVYRPEPTRVLQPKTTAPSQQPPSHTNLRPTQAPPAHRPGASVAAPPTAAKRPGILGRVASVVQRAITIGMQKLPRSSSLTEQNINFLKQQGIETPFRKLNDDRKYIYIFSSEQNMTDYLKEMAGLLPKGTTLPPFTHKVPEKDLEQGHKLVQDLRFSTIYEPSSNQVPKHAPGVHNIEEGMLPPPGEDHHYMRAKGITGKDEYLFFRNKFTDPKPTKLRTYGDPKKPSFGTNQNGLNLGMYIMPTDDPRYFKILKRNGTTYGYLDSVTGRVRGHPLALRQNQLSTDGKSNFDIDWEMYTDESDSTKGPGGVSTWRYNQIENPSIKNMKPFLQVNVNPKKGKMGISKPDELLIRRPYFDKKKTGYDDIRIDNTGTTDYRNVKLPKGKRKQENQTDMGRDSAKRRRYDAPKVHKPKQDFDDPNKKSWPGYMSPPPSPFCSEEFTEKPFRMTLKGVKYVNDRVEIKTDGRKCIVTEVVKYNSKEHSTTCMLVEVPQTNLPSFFS